ncbi:coenzyme A transporter [Zygosaccharomyces mellis]|uniref:Coenzyme A transporter n=1 Tax=Zygosaccharomyces mellis TaxID=42258 RepID=A0A4C2EB07_9SACH|nr:coenzyme A transporter [Zygosaccharomyces mellis]
MGEGTGSSVVREPNKYNKGGVPSTTTTQSHVINKYSAEYIVRSGIAGGISGSCAKTLIAPLDRIKILFQTSNPHYTKYAGSLAGLVEAAKHIWINDGIRGFYQGHSVTLIRIFPYAAIKFVAYEQVRNVLIPTSKHEVHWRRLLSGSLAGLCSVFVTYPLDLLRVRLAYVTENKTRVRLLDFIRAIYGESASTTLTSRWYIPNWFAHWCNFYRGYCPTVLGMIPYAGVSFFAHDCLHDLLRVPLCAPYTVIKISEKEKSRRSQQNQRTPLTTWAELVAGGLAGMASQTAAYPFEIIRRRLQVSTLTATNAHEHKFQSIGGIAKIIYKERGWRGFFVGLSIGYIKVIPMVACSFFVYERMKWHLGI